MLFFFLVLYLREKNFSAMYVLVLFSFSKRQDFFPFVPVWIPIKTSSPFPFPTPVRWRSHFSARGNSVFFFFPQSHTVSLFSSLPVRSLFFSACLLGFLTPFPFIFSVIKIRCLRLVSNLSETRSFLVIVFFLFSFLFLWSAPFFPLIGWATFSRQRDRLFFFPPCPSSPRAEDFFFFTVREWGRFV